MLPLIPRYMYRLAQLSTSVSRVNPPISHDIRLRRRIRREVPPLLTRIIHVRRGSHRRVSFGDEPPSRAYLRDDLCGY